ncbi:MAG TPA: GNAT family N-acetyltransferase [Xanthobacteraceae bacterium]|jgi:putative acetyltransferase|nr:GNAT family N-acetyltransferase [Xanthobacteraceae bacterium]
MNATAHPKTGLRPYLPSDAALLADIFRASIEELTGDDYTQEQQQAWAAAADDLTEFAERLASRLSLVATLEGSPVGFAALEGADKIDMLYVHPAVTGQGVGAMLIDALERLAAARGAAKLVVQASDSASGFFQHRGFLAQTRNTVLRGDEWLANTTMEKKLKEPA